PPSPPLFPYTTLFRSLFATVLLHQDVFLTRQISTKHSLVGYGFQPFPFLIVVGCNMDQVPYSCFHRRHLLSSRPDCFLRQIFTKDRKSTRLNSSHVKI